jgi:hypothetical protein
VSFYEVDHQPPPRREAGLSERATFAVGAVVCVSTVAIVVAIVLVVLLSPGSGFGGLG